MKGVATFWCVFQLQTYEAITKRMIGSCLNSQVSSWFCRTNEPLIWPCPGLNMVVSQKCFKGLPLKFCFRPFGDIRSNRKWNIKSAVNRKYSFSSGIEGLKVWGMTWASRISPVTCHFLAINTFGCREPAWNWFLHFDNSFRFTEFQISVILYRG